MKNFYSIYNLKLKYLTDLILKIEKLKYILIYHFKNSKNALELKI